MLTDKILPNSIDFERTVLGSMMTDKVVAAKVFELLTPDIFYNTAHRKIFKTALQLFRAEKPVDIITINAALLESGELEQIGNSVYLAEIVENITSIENIEHFCREVLDRAARRQLIQSAESTQQAAYDCDLPLEKLVDLTNNMAALITNTVEHAIGNEQDKAEIIRPQALTERMIRYNEDLTIVPRGVNTGWVSVDKHYMPAIGTLNIITGAPAHGKSELLDALAVNIALQSQWKWLMFSPENYPTEIHLKKLIDKYLGKNIHTCTPGEISSAMEWINLYFRFIKLSEDNHNFDALTRLARQAMKDEPYQALVIDPWNELDIKGDEYEKETDRIGRQLAKLKRFGRRNDCAVFIAAHPAKMYRNRTTGKYDIPTLYDISGSAHYANRADNGLCVYRETDETTGALKDEIQLHVQKVKFKIHGSQGLIRLLYSRDNGRFYEPEGIGHTSWPQ